MLDWGASGRLAIVSIYLGQVAFAQKDIARAAAALQEGLALSREWDSAWGMAECLGGLAVVAGAVGQAQRFRLPNLLIGPEGVGGFLDIRVIDELGQVHLLLLQADFHEIVLQDIP